MVLEYAILEEIGDEIKRTKVVGCPFCENLIYAEDDIEAAWRDHMAKHHPNVKIDEELIDDTNYETLCFLDMFE